MMILHRETARAVARSLAVPLYALLGTTALAPAARAQCLPTQLNKILASDGGIGDQHGVSVAFSASGATALVGAPFDDDFSMNSGAVYVYVFNGANWSFQAKLKANDNQTLDQFGGSVAINAAGDRAIVGARFDDDNGMSSGSAYVFQRTGTAWTQQAKLKAADGLAGDEFGTDVDIDDAGDFAVVGAPFDDLNIVPVVPNTGSIYLFQFGGVWQGAGKLLALDAAANEDFGASVALGSAPSTILVGAPAANLTPLVDAGAAYLFSDQGGGWGQITKLVAPDAEAFDQFGDSVALDGLALRALVGSIGDDVNGADSGSAYVFEGSGAWVFEAKLLAQNGAAGDHFGFSVELDGNGDRAAIGAPQGDGLTSNTGAAYVFARNLSNWAQLSRLQAGDGAGGDAFGNGVALTNAGEKAFVGARADDDLGNDSGSAYLFPTQCSTPIAFFCFGDGSLTTPCPCGNFGAAGRGCANSQNSAGALLNAGGFTNPDSITLTASGELPTVLSAFFQGDQELSGGTTFGDGVRCAGGLLLRLYIKNASGGTVTAPGTGDPSISARSAALGDPIQPGTLRFYQVYYRDPDLAFCSNPPGNSWNVTNAAQIFW